MHPVPIRDRSPLPSGDADFAFGVLMLCAPLMAFAGGVPLAGCALTAFAIYEVRWIARRVRRWLAERD